MPFQQVSLLLIAQILIVDHGALPFIQACRLHCCLFDNPSVHSHCFVLWYYCTTGLDLNGEDQRGRSYRENLKSRLANFDEDGLDNPKFLEAFGNLGHNVHNFDLDEASVFSDLNAEEGQGLDNSSRHREPSKKKKKKKKSNRPRQPELDNSRPDSDRNTFGKLQDAKAQLRRQKNFHPNRHEFSPTMVSTRTSNEPLVDDTSSPAPVPRKRSKENRKNGDGGENVPANGQNNDESAGKGNKKRKDHPEEETDDDDDEEDNGEEHKDTPATAFIKKMWKVDSKIHLKDRGERIKELHYQTYHLNEKNVKTLIIAKKFKKQVEELEKTVDVLKKKLANSAISQDHAQLLKKNAEILKACKEIAKTKLWKNMKFIADADSEVKAAEFVLQALGRAELENPETKANMIKTYKSEIRKAMFAQKNYVASELKKVASGFLKDGKTIPTVDDMKKCITRNIVTEADMELFMWYWEVVLTKMIGARDWDTSVRYYTTISKARDPEDQSVRLVSVSDEAMILLLWENSYDRYMTEWEWEQVPANADAKKPKWPGKFSKSDMGQTQFGGWLPEGYKAFNDYYALVKDARKDSNCLKVEKKCLEKLREKHKITQNSRDEQEKRNRQIQRAEKKGKEIPLAMPVQVNAVKPVWEINSEEEDSDSSNNDADYNNNDDNDDDE